MKKYFTISTLLTSFFMVALFIGSVLGFITNFNFSFIHQIILKKHPYFNQVTAVFIGYSMIIASVVILFVLSIFFITKIKRYFYLKNIIVGLVMAILLEIVLIGFIPFLYFGKSFNALKGIKIIFKKSYQTFFENYTVMAINFFLLFFSFIAIFYIFAFLNKKFKIVYLKNEKELINE